jgi:predicted transcriptional regulator
MEVIRVVKNKNYTTVCNNLFKDKRISLKAKGLLSLMLALPTNWDLTIKGLEKICKEGSRSIASTIKELIDKGYIERNQRRDNGNFAGYDYYIFEAPKRYNADTRNAIMQNSTQLSKEIINNVTNKDIKKEEKFIEEVMAYDYPKELKEDFIEYWCEKTKRGVLKKDTMKTWCTSRRLKTWAKNELKWQKKGMSAIEKHISSQIKAETLLKQYHDKNN